MAEEQLLLVNRHKRATRNIVEPLIMGTLVPSVSGHQDSMPGGGGGGGGGNDCSNFLRHHQYRIFFLGRGNGMHKQHLFPFARNVAITKKCSEWWNCDSVILRH